MSRISGPGWENTTLSTVFSVAIGQCPRLGYNSEKSTIFLFLSLNNNNSIQIWNQVLGCCMCPGFRNRGQCTQVQSHKPHNQQDKDMHPGFLTLLNKAFLIVPNSCILSWKSHTFLSNAILDKTVKLGNSLHLLI